MPFAAGVFSLVSGNPVVTGTTISSAWANNTLADIANNGLSICLLKDGSQTVTANIPMNSFKLTGLAAGTAAGNSVRYEQSPDGLLTAKGSLISASAANTSAELRVGTDGYALKPSSGSTTGLAWTGPSNFELTNVSLTASVGSSALTVALKGADGNDPSDTNPVFIPFRNVTAATGTPSILKVTAATSIVVSSGSTLGTSSAVLAKLWIVGFNDAGTFRLGIYNPVNGANVLPPADDQLNSSTAEGGSGGADSAQVYYTGSAVSSKAMRILGYIEATEATAGTWATTPSKVQLYGPGVQLPATVSQTFLGSDVNLNNTANYFNICNTGSIGSAGQTWKISACLTALDTSGAATITARIWDGSSAVYVETPALVGGASTGSGVAIPLAAIVTLTGATTFHLSAKDTSSTSGIAKTTGAAGTANKATWIMAERVA